MECNLKRCYECPRYEDCETRYQYHAAPILLAVMTVGLLGAIIGVIVVALT